MLEGCAAMVELTLALKFCKTLHHDWDATQAFGVDGLFYENEVYFPLQYEVCILTAPMS